MKFDPVIDLTTTQSTDLQLALPRELAYMIIDRAIFLNIKNCNFELAMNLICIDRSTMIRFYHRYLDPIDRYVYFDSLLNRLSGSFYLMQKIFDGVLQFPNEEHDHYIALDIPFTTHKYSAGYNYNPWNFQGIINIIQIPRPGIFGIEDFRAFVTGPYITDVVWMNGQNNNGITTSSFFRLPVIVLMLVDEEGEIIPKREDMEKHVVFRNFSKILKLAFGPDTGIFYTVQGIYILDDQVLVEL